MLDFPPGTPGATYTGPNGTTWSWDGAKWLAGTSANVYAPVASPAFSGNPTAPTPPVGDADTSLATTQFVSDAVATSLHDVGRNLIHNSMFNVQQRGSGSWSASGNYTADRWVQFFAGGSMATSVNPSGDGARAQTGDESMAYQLYTTFTGTAGAGDLALMQQNIEGLRRLSGKTVTVSFWAASGTGSKVGVSMDQNFGTGGSPSALVPGTGQSVTLTGTFARYSLTFTLPSTAGKTFGTNNNDMVQMSFWFSSGSTYAARAGNIGAQTGNISIWGIQLELGTVATPLEKLDPVTQLQQCQRFYQVGNFKSDTYSAAGNASGVYQSFPVQMRATPVVTPTFNIQTNGASGGASAVSIYGVEIYTVATAAGYVTISGPFTASADL